MATTTRQKRAVGKQGRPALYSEELGAQICELLAEGNTLSSVCKAHPDLPSERTIRRWALDPEHPFSPQYARAREVGYHKMADDLLDIADNSETEPGKVARDRLRTDSRKWLLSKALPKVYGDKLAIGGDPEGSPVQLTGITIEFVEPGTANRKSLPPPDDGTGGSSV